MREGSENLESSQELVGILLSFQGSGTLKPILAQNHSQCSHQGSFMVVVLAWGRPSLESQRAP